MLSILKHFEDRISDISQPDLSKISGLPFLSGILSRLPDPAAVPLPPQYPPKDTIYGTDAGESLSGTASGDVINSLGGSDTVYGKAGDDVIVTSGNGFDRLYGDEGNDELHGGSSGNLFHGGSGDDHAYGGNGGDKINGDSGNDFLHGGDGVDKVSGGFGNDTVIGGNGTDELVGGFGEDAFRFDRLDGSVDLVSDFNYVPDVDGALDQGDHFELSLSAFTALSGSPGETLSDDAFALGAKAKTSSQHILYDQAGGALIYDADGNGAAKAVQFASLAGHVELRASDFVLIS
ncbi:MAG TPA: calcium-binding protein [Microvirga sp.]|jgi:Ca2+-binding RTX toxin-like protein|nr:calcium-binding protein [Microvirga sp.]